MSIINREGLKKFFARGKYPTEEQFGHLIDSFYHKKESVEITSIDDLSEAIADKAEAADLQTHSSDKGNPHGVTAAQVGLGAVDNTSDLDKPISLAMQEALDRKLSLERGEALEQGVEAHVTDNTMHIFSLERENWNGHVSSTSNPHGVTAVQVGLGAVDNTADLDKPISLATQVALDNKETLTGAQTKASEALVNAKAYADSLVGKLVDGSPEALDTLQELAAALGSDPNFATTIATQIGEKAGKEAATTASNGLMSFADKIKLDGVAPGANNYTHPVAHPASIITQDTTHRFVADTEKSQWNSALQAADVPAWAKASTKPSYTASEVGAASNGHGHYEMNQVELIRVKGPVSYIPNRNLYPTDIGDITNYLYVDDVVGTMFSIGLPADNKHIVPFTTKDFSNWSVVEVSVTNYGEYFVWTYCIII